MPAESAREAGLAWYPNGQSALGGALYGLYDRLERLFLSWAGEAGCEPVRFPTFLPASELQKIDYLTSFPHLATFPTNLKEEPANLAAFTGAPLGDDGAVKLTDTVRVRDVLTPAACYHIYVWLQGQDLGGLKLVTTMNTCFRREAYYAPLQRQWAFSMRELVAIGSEEEVRGFLDGWRRRLEGFFERLGLPVRWEHATDPFFNPKKNPKYIAQRLEPVKHEMVFGETLAIGSINFHRDYMGEAFGIRRAGEPAKSGCVAFGIERWLFAITETFGIDPAGWPSFEEAGAA